MREQLEQFEKRVELATLLSEGGLDVPYNEADHALVDDIIKKACKSYLDGLQHNKKQIKALLNV
ncbi:hypothetical protein [Porphyromonas endodontalis]